MQAHLLPDGRLHLHHGPVDLLIGAMGTGRMQGFSRARDRFDGLLQELVDELAQLRTPLDLVPQVHGLIARRMLATIRPYQGQFVTPMAAVAGAVAEVVLAAMQGDGLEKAYVNNGGDLAVYLAKNQKYSGAVSGVAKGRIVLNYDDPWRGIATSGWRGRSHSLGIADSVTVLARTAAEADVAATMIANAVDLPDHSAILRQAACELMPDSDLGTRAVTVDVGSLARSDKQQALENGRIYARKLLRKGLIGGALLSLQGEIVSVGEGGFHLGVTGEGNHERV
ncbi:MAG: UPF0280 family protein [Rhodobacteraceae bacterium]|nr:UPF0280 family protein [Paracoccaceae bacterium]